MWLARAPNLENCGSGQDPHPLSQPSTDAPLVTPVSNDILNCLPISGHTLNPKLKLSSVVFRLQFSSVNLKRFGANQKPHRELGNPIPPIASDRIWEPSKSGFQNLDNSKLLFLIVHHAQELQMCFSKTNLKKKSTCILVYVKLSSDFQQLPRRHTPWIGSQAAERESTCMKQ